MIKCDMCNKELNGLEMYINKLNLNGLTFTITEHGSLTKHLCDTCAQRLHNYIQTVRITEGGKR